MLQACAWQCSEQCSEQCLEHAWRIARRIQDARRACARAPCGPRARGRYFQLNQRVLPTPFNAAGAGGVVLPLVTGS